MLTHLPPAAGLGLRSPHIPQVLAQSPQVAWWEVHSENYFGGGAPLAALTTLRCDYAISLHGVGLGLGNQERPDPHHLEKLCALAEQIQPAMVSEHLAWNRNAQTWFNDLLPVPRLEGAIDLLARNIQIVQEALKHPILLENISAYVQFSDEILSEAEFISLLVQRTGCGLLLDLNNLYVNQLNLGLNAQQQLDLFPLEYVGEIHIAGHEVFDGVVIDTHGAPVDPAVWDLLTHTLERTGPLPVLLERDTQLPTLELLLEEHQQLVRHLAAAGRAQAIRCPA